MKTINKIFRIAIGICGLISITFQFNGRFNSNNSKLIENTITLELRLDPKKLKDSGQSKFSPVDYIEQNKWKSEWKKHKNGVVTWTIKANEPIYLNMYDLLVEPKYGFWLVEPGDQVVITAQGSHLIFSGKGYEKYALQYQLDTLQLNVSRPANHRDYQANSIADYFEWHNYLEKKIHIGIPLINAYKNKISDYSFGLLKDKYVNNIIADLCSKFGALRLYMESNNFPMKSLCSIYDTAYSRATEKWSHYLSKKESYYLPLLEYKIYRKLSFDKNRIPSKEKINLMLCYEALKIYTGAKKEQYIVNHYPEQLMIEVGFTPEVEKMLDEYYAEPEYPEYKKWMKEQELKIREKKISYKAPDFSLMDKKGKSFSKENIKGKFAVLNFWVTGSAACEQMATAIKKVQDNFRNDTNVVFLNICVDKNKELWLGSVTQEKFTAGNGVHLYTGGEGEDHRMIRQYAVNSYPTLWVMHPEGKIIRTNPKLDPSKDNGKALTELIQKYLAYSKDGPYVLHDENISTALYVNKNELSKTSLARNGDVQLSVQTDLDKTFKVILKKFHTSEPSTYIKPNKLLALSDIEGNFDAFRKLLQMNQVIDENFNWTFGNGHLVFAGDMFDRGLQVTECLWLIYSLEEKAKSAGGHVHFILGNHEIMNLQGDHRYVQKKYKENAALIGKTLTQLYNEESELGRWLRTKNIVETIGDLLFVHGGISHQVWRMPLTITEINELARPYYAKSIDSTNQHLVILFGNKRVGSEKSYPSPFWFRGYYGDIDNPYEIPTMIQLDSALNKYGVKKIITGHTIKADTISVHYGGKIINTDTEHAEGKSEALLIENNNFYRVNMLGIRKRLF